uniref:Transmembrane BAX inhibitor motif containing 6 n=1 Tax=Apteryx owenii TaxID=8824 RepID=A0A8B9QJJ5_APTOW
MFVAAAGAYVNMVTHLFQVRGARGGGQHGCCALRPLPGGCRGAPRARKAGTARPHALTEAPASLSPPQFSLLTGFGALGLMVWLTATPHSKETEQKRLGMLAGFAFLTGINLGPLLEMCISINPSIIPTAFLGTATIFACFSLSALYARRRSFLYLGGFLLSGLTLMLLSSLVNAFVGSTWLFTANLYLGLMIMCGFVLFDTQLIIEKAESGDKDYIWHCVDLFLDFVNIFRELLMILGMTEN